MKCQLATLALLATLAPAASAHVVLNAPDGDAMLCPGETFTIEWQVHITHLTQNWDLLYSTTGEAGPFLPIEMDLPPGDISAGAIHTYEWAVPNDPSNDVWIRIVQDNLDTDYMSTKAVPVIHGPASAVSRNAGSNPITYTAGGPIMGFFFSASVDNGAVGQSTSVLFAFDTPVTLTLGGGQTLLAFGTEEMFTGSGLLPTGGALGLDTYGLAIPNDFALCGLELSSQAIQFGTPPFVLSNAQDLTVGGF